MDPLTDICELLEKSINEDAPVTVKEGDEPTIDTSSEIEVYYEKPSRAAKDKPIKPKVVVKAKHNHRSKAPQRPATSSPPANRDKRRETGNL